jgi:hypothetical protein
MFLLGAAALQTFKLLRTKQVHADSLQNILNLYAPCLTYPFTRHALSLGGRSFRQLELLVIPLIEIFGQLET